MTKEQQYLETLAALHARAWPDGLPHEPRYPFGEIPLTEYLREWARRQPEKPAYIFYGSTLTYGELDRLSDGFAAVLAERGIGPGDRVAVFLPNCPQFAVAFFGILKRGAIHVPVNPMFKAAELRYELQDSAARAIVVSDQLYRVLEEVRAATSVELVFTTSLADVLPANPTLPVPPAVMSPKRHCAGTTDFLSALAGAAGPAANEAVGLDDIAVLNYTGGTTGMPKGCIHTQGDMIYTAATTVPMSLNLDRDGVYVCMFQMFWMAGEVFGLIFPVFAGATVILLTRWDAVAFMEAVQRYRATHASLLVDGAVEVMNHARVGNYDLRSLRTVGVASFVKKLNPEFRSRWRALTGATLREIAYGMTETHTCDTCNYGSMQDDDFDLKSQPVFVGIPVPGTKVKICDFSTGALKPLGEEGEICIRSPSLLKGYWNKPEESASAFRDGWFHTGDIGVYDEKGYLHFLGRRKEMLKVNGMSVFPGELEAMLGQYPTLLGCGVVGRPDEAKGEVPVAFVLLSPEERNEAGQSAFAAWCARTIAVYKLPEMRFVDQLPMTETGKVKKEVLKQML